MRHHCKPFCITGILALLCMTLILSYDFAEGGKPAVNALCNNNVTIVCEEGGTIEAWALEHGIEVAWTE